VQCLPRRKASGVRDVSQKANSKDSESTGKGNIGTPDTQRRTEKALLVFASRFAEA
jgi:hypothetical protein